MLFLPSEKCALQAKCKHAKKCGILHKSRKWFTLFRRTGISYLTQRHRGHRGTKKIHGRKLTLRPGSVNRQMKDAQISNFNEYGCGPFFIFRSATRPETWPLNSSFMKITVAGMDENAHIYRELLPLQKKDKRLYFNSKKSDWPILKRLNSLVGVWLKISEVTRFLGITLNRQGISKGSAGHGNSCQMLLNSIWQGLYRLL